MIAIVPAALVNPQTMKNRFYFFLDLGKLLRLALLLLMLLVATCSCSESPVVRPSFAKVFADEQPVKVKTSALRRP